MSTTNIHTTHTQIPPHTNTTEIWKNQWAFVEEETGRAAVVGEWGGHYEEQDKVWQDAFASFLVDQCLEDTFYWW